MRTRWFGPKLGSGRGLSALIGGLVPASWQGWGVTLLLLAALIGVSFVDVSVMQAWALRGGAIAAFLIVAVLTYGRDPA